MSTSRKLAKKYKKDGDFIHGVCVVPDDSWGGSAIIPPSVCKKNEYLRSKIADTLAWKKRHNLDKRNDNGKRWPRHDRHDTQDECKNYDI